LDELRASFGQGFGCVKEGEVEAGEEEQTGWLAQPGP